MPGGEASFSPGPEVSLYVPLWLVGYAWLETGIKSAHPKIQLLPTTENLAASQSSIKKKV